MHAAVRGGARGRVVRVSYLVCVRAPARCSAAARGVRARTVRVVVRPAVRGRLHICFLK
jgi:hypothetical protein